MSENAAAHRAPRIVVCVRQALDWNVSTRDFRIDQQTQEPVIAFARYRIDQFDEIAVEVALQAKKLVAADVHAISVGTRAAEDVLKHALAMGADTASLLEVTGPRAHCAPTLIATSILASGGADIVLCGRMGSERGTGATAALVAELLSLPLVTNVVRIEHDGKGWICQRENGRSYERVLVRTPFVGSVTNATFNVPRTPGLRDKMRAHREKIEIVEATALRTSAAYRDIDLASTRVVRRYVPQTGRESTCLDGAVRDQARSLSEYIAAAMASSH